MHGLVAFSTASKAAASWQCPQVAPSVLTAGVQVAPSHESAIGGRCPGEAQPLPQAQEALNSTLRKALGPGCGWAAPLPLACQVRDSPAAKNFLERPPSRPPPSSLSLFLGVAWSLSKSQLQYEPEGVDGSPSGSGSTAAVFHQSVISVQVESCLIHLRKLGENACTEAK